MTYHSVKQMLIICLVFVSCHSLSAQHKSESPFPDSLSKKEIREKKKTEMKNSHSRFFINMNYVFAKLNTTASFELTSGLLSANIGLEKNLGLPDSRSFFTGSFIYRITPGSGIYFQYYGINRKKSWQIDQDIIFLNDTIHAGTQSIAHFNTQVLSAGYLFTIVKNPNSFLGAYINVYLITLKTGVKSNLGNIDLNVNMTAPLPNFGLIAMFKLTNWMNLDANIGFFSLQTATFGGTIYNLNISLLFKPTKWLGFNLSYQEFDVNVVFPSNNINTNIDYNFKGPALGIKLYF